MAEASIQMDSKFTSLFLLSAQIFLLKHGQALIDMATTSRDVNANFWTSKAHDIDTTQVTSVFVKIH